MDSWTKTQKDNFMNELTIFCNKNGIKIVEYDFYMPEKRFEYWIKILFESKGKQFYINNKLSDTSTIKQFQEAVRNQIFRHIK